MAVIFGPDAFVVGADTNIDAYPGGSPDYAYSRGSAGNMVVEADTDKVRGPNTAVVVVARCINAAVSASMVDQEARADIAIADQFADLGLGVRYSTSTRGYYSTIHLDEANEILLYEDNAGFTLLASKTGSFGTTLAATACALRAVTNGSNCELSWTVGAVSALTYTDTGTVIASGAPAMSAVFVGNVGDTIDNFTVDDLVRRPNLIVPQAVQRAASW